MKLQEVILRNYRGFRISLQYIIAAREYFAFKSFGFLFLNLRFSQEYPSGTRACIWRKPDETVKRSVI